jgi:hypothetical protein
VRLVPLAIRRERLDGLEPRQSAREETMAEPKEPNAEALVAFIARKAAIDRLLAQLLARSHEHLNLAPEKVHWGHVGELDEWLARLRRVVQQSGMIRPS